jgi:ABC-type oligopeptide transport system ATPase subunit
MAFFSIERASKYFPLQDGIPGRTGRQESFCVFRDIDLRIDRGEFVTLIGHSWCGKSTLLNIVAGFEQASAGGVILDGKEVMAPSLDRFHEITQVYGTTIKALIHEMFGDGIMSAIDFEMDIRKEEDPKGDRVIVTCNGKFLPYKKW